MQLQEVLGFIHLDGPAFLQFLDQSGIDLRRDMIELELFVSVWSATGSPRGVLVDERCQTNVRGFYAAGDLATPSYSFAGAITTGYVAGLEASRAAARLGPPEPDPGRVEAETERAARPLTRPQEIGWVEYEAHLQETMGRYLHISRSRLGMLRGAAHLARLEADGERVGARNARDLIRTLEGQDILLFDRMMVAAALARDESRFNYLIGHYRSDFPESDDARWKGVANVVTWDGRGPCVAQRRMS